MMDNKIINEKKFKINFTKLHGAGNDFIVFEKNKVERVNGDTTPVTIQELSDITTKLSHRKLGVGCDQLIIINDEPIQSSNIEDERVDFEMSVINCDGNIENMCGNGVRCFSKYIIDNNILSKTNVNSNNKELQIIKTKSGIIKTYPKLNHRLTTNEMTMIKVNMGQPKVCTNIIHLDSINITSDIDNGKYLYTIDIGLPYCKQLECVFIYFGAPQCVVFVDRNIKLGNLDPSYGDYNKFPFVNIQVIATIIFTKNQFNFTEIPNVEFVIQSEQDKLENRVISRVVEYGLGETLACGTGASGVAIASILQGYVNRSSPSPPSHDNNTSSDDDESNITVEMPGGKLIFQWDPITNNIYKTGPATTVFKSQIII